MADSINSINKSDERSEHRIAQKAQWSRENRDKKNAAYRRHREKQPQDYERRRKLKAKYGITPEEYDEMFRRQGGKCLITGEPFDGTPHVDHCHETGKVRGLLSNNANAALGFLKENPESFYKAVAYLTRDPSKKLVYVIGSLRNDLVPDVAKSLRQEGFDAFDNWYAAGKTADDSWQEYSHQKGLSYTEALSSREANHVFRFDKAYLDLCDAAILVMPAGKSGFLELGYVLGSGKPAYILLDEGSEKNRYDVMPQFASIVSNNLFDIVEDINSDTKGLAGSRNSAVSDGRSGAEWNPDWVYEVEGRNND